MENTDCSAQLQHVQLTLTANIETLKQACLPGVCGGFTSKGWLCSMPPASAESSSSSSFAVSKSPGIDLYVLLSEPPITLSASNNATNSTSNFLVHKSATKPFPDYVVSAVIISVCLAIGFVLPNDEVPRYSPTGDGNNCGTPSSPDSSSSSPQEGEGKVSAANIAMVTSAAAKPEREEHDEWVKIKDTWCVLAPVKEE
jgi:hypothetical protein